MHHRKLLKEIAMSSKQVKGKAPKQITTPSASKKVATRNLTAINPKTEQFEPTEGRPIRQHVTMAGGS